MARALYSDATLLLLDDILAAVDAKTLSDLVANIFADPGAVLEHRTCILVTNAPQVGRYAKSVSVMRSGELFPSSVDELPGVEILEQSLPQDEKAELIPEKDGQPNSGNDLHEAEVKKLGGICT